MRGSTVRCRTTTKEKALEPHPCRRCSGEDRGGKLVRGCGRSDGSGGLSCPRGSTTRRTVRNNTDRWRKEKALEPIWLPQNYFNRKLLPKSELPPILIGVFRSLRVVFRARDLVFRVLRRPNKFPMNFSIFLAKSCEMGLLRKQILRCSSRYPWI